MSGFDGFVVGFPRFAWCCGRSWVIRDEAEQQAMDLHDAEHHATGSTVTVVGVCREAGTVVCDWSLSE